MQNKVKQNKFKNLSIERKFFVSMLVSSIVIVLTITFATITVFYYNFIKNESSASKKQLEYVSTQLDFFLNSVNNYSKSILSDPVIQEITLQHKTDDTFDITAYSTLLESTIEHIIQSTDYIHSVTIYDYRGIYLCSTNIYSLHQTPLDGSDNPFGTWSSTMQNSISSSREQVTVLSLSRPFFSYVTGEPLGYLEISILETSISAIYSEQASENSTTFITNQDGRIESTVNYLSIGDAFPDFEDISLTQNFSSHFQSGFVIFYKYMPTLDWYIFSKINIGFFFQPLYLSFFICLVISIVCILSYAVLANHLAGSITAPLHALIAHTKTIKQGNWSPMPFKEVTADREMSLLVESFNSMILSQETLKNELLETQQAKNKLSLDLLHQQINPHFLYNTLDNICSLAEIGEQKALIDIVMNLSTFYRETLSSGRSYITLSEELTLTKAYLHIMQIRYFEQFDFTIHCDDSLLPCECIKLLLQPIVENSIYHGIKEIDHKGLLDISVTAKDGNLKIVVSDNGIGLSNDSYERIWNPDNGHFGLINIHQRVQLYYGSSYGLIIGNNPTGGCITTITIPIRGISL